MDVPRVISHARSRSGLTQHELARRIGTSQATLSAYENGAKAPTVRVLQRLLGATGSRLTVGELPGEPAITKARQAATARTLGEVLALAEALPVRHDADLAYPRLPGGAQ